jgi:amino-acid N-acetyltransferase
LHFYGPHLCEVRSIVVKPEAKGKGAGGQILNSLIQEAEEHGIQSVCLFTRIPDFFFKYGFRIVEDKSDLPDKVFKDCQSCPRLHRCDEVAMVRGRLPRVSLLGAREEAQELVRIAS